MSLKTPGGTDGRFFGKIENVLIVGGGGTLSDCAYIKGGLDLDVNLRTQGGRYALYLTDTSNSRISIHAGVNTCNGVMIKNGGNNSLDRARIEDSSTINTRNLSSVSGDGTTLTFVTSTAHGMESFDRCTVSGTTGFNFTSPRLVTVVDATTFTVPGTVTSGSVSSGVVRISSAAFRIKDAGDTSFYNCASEGKSGIHYGVWIQGTGTSSTGEPSATHNNFFGSTFAGPENSGFDDLATCLIEGNVHQNRFIGTLFEKISGIKSSYYDIMIRPYTDSSVRPRFNIIDGVLYTGTGNTGTMRTSLLQGFGNFIRLSERVAEKILTNGYVIDITGDYGMSPFVMRTTISCRGMFADSTITAFPSYAGMEKFTIINNGTHNVSFDPYSSEVVGQGGPGKKLILAAGASVTLKCITDGFLDIESSTGTLSYEP